MIRGHRENLNLLKNLIRNDRLTHANIFSGRSGIGKKMVAMECAKDLLCTEGTAACGRCLSCREYDNGANPDYLEISEPDGIIKVARVKEIVDFVSTRPILSSRKVIVIDEAEKMNVESQNKFLKTLEEPPSFCTMFLVTSNESKLLDTIKSRCTTYDFKPLEKNEIVDILTGEYDAKELEFAAKFASGSITGAMNILGDDFTKEIISLPEEIMEEIIREDELRLIKIGNRFDRDKGNINLLLDYLLTWIRDISIVKGNVSSTLVLSSDKLDVLKRQSNYFDMDKLMSFRNDIEQAKTRIERNVNPSVTLSYCLLKLQEDYKK